MKLFKKTPDAPLQDNNNRSNINLSKHKAPVAVTFVVLFAAIGTFVLGFGRAAPQVTTNSSGSWSDPAIWDGDTVPTNTDEAVISSGHSVTYDQTDSRVSGITVEAGATLEFDPSQSTTIETDRNVIVEGGLVMKPANQDINHTLRFVEVDETAMAGGGMEVLESDVGLWVIGSGVLDARGAEKTSWTNLSGSANQGDDQITVEDASNWQAGDELAISPTEDPDEAGAQAYNEFDEVTVQSVSGNNVTLTSALKHNHPQVTSPNTDSTFTAEVMNLTRNVRLEGTGDGSADPSNNGRAHVIFMSDGPQDVRYIQIKHMGPRQEGESNPTDEVLGRYSLHFHKMAEAARGTLVEGVVARQSGSRAFVPHGSHGVTMQDSVAYDGWESAYWWDSPAGDPTNNTDDVMWDRNIAAKIKTDPSFRGYSTSGFVLGAGRDNTVRNSVAVGVRNKSVNAGGFHWPSKANQEEHNVWLFHDNIAHNNRGGAITVWQNDGHPHIVDDSVAYRNNGAGINQGAYGNRYLYRNLDLFDNARGVVQHARGDGSNPYPNGYSLTFDRVQSNDPLEFTSHTFAPTLTPTLYLDCSFPSVRVDEDNNPGHYDFVRCGLEPEDFDFVNVLDGMQIRVQRADGSAYQIDDQQNVTGIDTFYDYSSQHETPEISNVNTVNVTDSSATVTWATDRPATEFIAYRESECSWCNRYAGRSLSDTDMVFKRDHKVILDDLEPGTDYEFEIKSRGEFLNPARTQTMSFSTLDAENSNAPSATLTSPQANTTQNGTSDLTVDLENDGNVSGVDYYIDGQARYTANSAPYAASWDTISDTDGMHTVTAVAKDQSGNLYMAEEATVNVRNSPLASNVVFHDDWDGADGAAWNSDKWSETGGTGTIDLLSNEGRMEYASTPSGGVYKDANMEPLADSEVLFRTHMTGGTRAHFRVILRASGNWENRYTPTSGYELHRRSDGSKIEINAIQDGSREELGTIRRGPPEEGNRIWIRFRVDGNNVKVRTWRDGKTEPTNWALDIEDNSVPGEGILKTAFNRSGGSHNVFLDNLTVMDLATADPDPTPEDPSDTTNPTVSLTNPAEGATVSDTATVAADASDDTAVDQVEFFVDGSLLNTDTSSPYEFDWDTTTATDGSHALEAVAADAAGNTSSDQISVTVDNADSEAPTAPSNLSAEAVAANQVDLTWDASTDNVGVGHYNIYRDHTLIARVDTTAYADTTVNESTTYNYHVTAEDTVGNESDPSGTASLTTPAEEDTQAPTAPANLSANAVDADQIDLTWDASSDDTAVDGYYVYRDDAVIATLGSSAISYSDTAVSADTTYDYYVKAFDAADNVSDKSNTQTVTTPTSDDTEAPSAPTNLQAISPNKHQTDLTWDASTDNVAVSHYEVFRDGSLLATTPTTGFGDGTVSPNKTYDYTVRAVDTSGNKSGFSDSATVTTPDSDPPAGDFNGDGTVDIFDLSILLSSWKTDDPAADLNGDGTVDIFDLSILLSNFGEGRATRHDTSKPKHT